MANKISVSELDFDRIKTNFKQFLKSQNQFKDYDFEGSGLSVLLDVLAYNTHYNSYYANMVANEMFLDTAELRESVVSRAKMLGYTPRSVTGAKVSVRIDVLVPIAQDPAIVVIPQWTKYKTTIDGVTYYFTTTDAHTAQYSYTDGAYKVYSTPYVYLTEGLYVKQTYVHDEGNPSQRLIITNSNIDTTTLQVRVQRSETNTSISEFIKTVSIAELNGDSQVYFLQEIEKSLYEIYFGDGKVGKALEQGNIVTIEYLASKGEAANGAKTLEYTTPIEGYAQNVTLNPGNTQATGGADRESLESIRYLAPLFFNSQNRVVTSTDYKTVILQNYSNVQAVTSWGGETNDPPIYGKVFISLKPKIGFTIDDVAKEQISSSILKNRNVVSITPEFVDPQYLYIKPSIYCYFNREIGSYSASDIQTAVANAVASYSVTKLEQFNSYFQYSRFLQVVDNSNPSIVNSNVSLILGYNVEVTPNQSRSYSAKYSNAIFYPHEGHFGSFYSSQFTYFGNADCYLSDDGYGVINVYRTVLAERKLIDTNIGLVDYLKGRVDILNFAPEAAPNAQISLNIVPAQQDIFAVREQILQINRADIIVSATDSQTRYTAEVNKIFANN